MEIIMVCGFLGAGKTTFLNWLLPGIAQCEKTALLENDFGEASVDELLLQGGGVPVYELKNGCICCTLQGDFSQAVAEIQTQLQPERLFLEPSGVSNAREVACSLVKSGYSVSVAALVDAKRCHKYLRVMGESFTAAIEAAGLLVLTRTEGCTKDALADTVRLLRLYNSHATLYDAPYQTRTPMDVLAQLQTARFSDTGFVLRMKKPGLAVSLQTVTVHTDHRFTPDELQTVFARLAAGACGQVLRAKGFVCTNGDSQLQVQYVPGECSVQPCRTAYPGILCFIGTELNAHALRQYFGGTKQP